MCIRDSLIAELPNRVGVRSFTKSGAPVAVDGWVLNATNDTLMAFKTNPQVYGNFFIMPPSTPVSYTHLDVYKRQVLLGRWRSNLYSSTPTQRLDGWN